MERSRVLWGLRIAVTALSLAESRLLIALWVRSHHWCDVGYAQIGGIRYDVTSLRGCIALGWQKGRANPPSQLFPAAGAALDRDIREPYFWFAARKRPTGHWSVLPMWFPNLIGLGTAAAPWLRWRFSLRTLLIATTLFAVVLGLVVLVT